MSRAVALAVLALAVAPAAAHATVVDRVLVRANGGNPAEAFPPQLAVVATSPPEYRRGCCLDSNGSEWRGPPSELTTGSRRDSTIDWGASFAEAEDPAAEARRSLVHDLRDYESGVLQVPHVVAGRTVGTIPAAYVATQRSDGSGLTAQAEGTVSFSLGLGVVATARFALLAPSSDSEVVHHQGGTARPTDWNRAQLGLALRGVALDGSLLPQRLTARRRGGRARGTVVDMYGHGVAGASVTLQRRVGRRWKRVSRGTTTASGTFSVRGSRRGRERVEVRIGGAIFWKAVKA